MELSLKNKDWGQFKLSSIFTIENCKCSKVADLQNGNMPYVGATNRNNGVMSFVKPIQNLKTKGNCIAFICDGEGSVGFSIYKKEDFIGSTTVKVGRNEFLNKYIGAFITTIADTVRSKYNFGFKRNATHLKKEILILPTNSKGDPDYEFMENYIRVKQQEKINAYKNYISKRISELENTKEVVPLSEKDWAEFFIEDIFTTKIGKNVDGNKVDKTKGKFAYITRKESNNGLDGFINFDKKILNKDYPVITIGNETAEPFVQNYPFFTGTKVNILKPKITLTRFSLTFVSLCLKMHKSKYSYSFTINSTRLKRQKIMLPINNNHEPDYEYMENYMKQLELNKLKKYLKYKNV